jgi:hypothetical protein
MNWVMMTQGDQPPYGKKNKQIVAIFEAIRQLMTPPERERKKIGFVNEPAARYRKEAKKKA